MENPEEERTVLNDMIKERAGNPYYPYGRQQRGVSDPSAQTEDVGDDAVEASRLGIANLKRIPDWTAWITNRFETFSR